MSGVSFLWTLQKWVCRTNLAHHQTVDSLSLFHRYYFVRCSYELLKLAQLPYSHGRPICYSDRLHDFSVTIPRCYKNLYISSFWAGVIFNFMFDKLQKKMQVTWLWCSIHPLNVLRDFTNFLLLWKAVILTNCMIFLSSLLDVRRIFMPAVSGLVLFLILCWISY